MNVPRSTPSEIVEEPMTSWRDWSQTISKISAAARSQRTAAERRRESQPARALEADKEQGAETTINPRAKG